MSSALLALAACASGGKKAAEEVKLPVQRFELIGDTVHLFALAGDVRLQRGEGSATVIEVTRVGEDAAQLVVDTGRVGGEQTLRARFPGARVTTELHPRGTTRVTVADDGRFGASVPAGRAVEITRGKGGIRAHASVVARVPSGRTVILDVAAGKVTVAGIDGNLRVISSTAEVQADSVRGTLALDVRAGTIKAAYIDGALSVNTATAPVTISQALGSRVEIRGDTASVNGSGIEAAQLNVRTRSGAVLLTGIRSRVARVITDSGRVGISHVGAADTVAIQTRSGDASLSLIGGLSSLASLRSHSGDLTIRVTDAVSATVLLEGELRAPTVETSLAELQRTAGAACTTSASDNEPRPGRCNVVRGRLGAGDAGIVAHSQQGDVRLAGF